MADGKRSARTDVDLEAVGRDFRTGQFTSRELGAKYGVSHRTINNWVEKYGWQKDLSADVRQATRTKLAKEAKETAEAQRRERIQAGQLPPDAEPVPDAVEVAAEVNKSVILGHRGDIKRLRAVGMGMVAELEQAAMTPDEMEKFAQMMAGDGADPIDVSRFGGLAEKRLGLTSRIGGFQKAVDALVKLQAAERTAFGLDEEGGKGKDTDLDRLTDEELEARIDEHLARRQG